MKAIGFNQGQIGDLAMCMIPCRSLKEKFPEIKITFGINKKYESASPIFFNNDLIDNIHIWENYDNWPSSNDKEFLSKNYFDFIFNPMPKMKNEKWYLHHHHTEETCLMHDLMPSKNLQINLTPWFGKNEQYKNCVALTCFSSAGALRDIPKDVADDIVDYIHSLGLETIQLGLTSHPKLKTTYPPINGSIFEDVKVAYSCKFLITADTGMNWLMSGYQSKVLGLYSYSSYPVVAPLKNRTPINPNGVYLASDHIYNISKNTIQKSILNLIK